jgi:Fe2+ transport system protein B
MSKLNVQKKTIEEKLVEHAVAINKLNENVTKLAVTVEEYAKVIAKQKEEIAAVKKETLELSLKSINEIRNVVLKIDSEFKNFKDEVFRNNNSNSSNSYDLIDFDFLAQEVAKRLNMQQRQQNSEEVENIEENSKKSFFDLKFVLTMLFLIIFTVVVFFGDYLKKYIVNAKNDKIIVKQQKQEDTILENVVIDK